jgi:lipopolysaccharide transport system permease protein
MVFNPVYSLVTGYQQILVFQTWPDTTPLLTGLVISTGLLLLGGFIYSRAAEDMADVL